MTAEPTYSDLTEDLWDRLPEVYRTEDAKRDWVFKNFVSGATDIAGDTQVLLDRFDYVTASDDPDADPNDTSDLIDSATADSAWLPWIGMVRGVKYNANLDEASIRTLLRSPDAYSKGNTQSIKSVVQTLLTGTKYVDVQKRTTDTSAKGAATQWDVLIVTRIEENSTLDAAGITAALVAANVKPAGVRFWHKVANPVTWNQIEAAYPTWNTWDSATSWDVIEKAGITS